MAAPLNLLLAGFGGQGVLFAGKVIAYAGLIEGRELSWLPSYGPEMRGGTANCSVCLSDEPIGSPLVTAPDVLVAMNQPSLDKFIGDVVPGGTIIVDSTLVPNIPARDDVRIVEVPATQLAADNNLKGLANIVMLGRLFTEIGFCNADNLDQAIVKSIPARKEALLESNRRALEVGIESGVEEGACTLWDPYA